MWVMRFMLAICLGIFSSYALDLTHKSGTGGISLNKNSFHLNKNIKFRTNKLPDLAIRSVSIKPNIKPKSKIGKNREISLNITNIGKAKAPKSILKLTCRARQGTCPKILNSYIMLNPIKCGRTLKIYWGKNSKERWSEGLFYITASVKLKPTHTFTNNQNQTKESNTRNNKKQFTIKVKSNEYIDFAIGDIKLSKKICANKRLNQNPKIKVKIANLGNHDAPKSTMCVKCTKVGSTTSFTTADFSSSCPAYLIGYAKIPPIKSGKTFILKWPQNSAKKWKAGRYKLLFNANCTARDGIKEHDTYDNNNKKLFKFEVKNCKSKLLPIKPVHVTTRPIVSTSNKEQIIFSSIFPSHWKQGKKYNIIIKGKKLNKKLDFRFSKDISILSQIFLNKKEIKLKIKVSTKAKTGKTYLLYNIKNSIVGKFIKTKLYGWIEKSVTFKKVMPKFKIKPITPDIKFPMGKILLEKPEFGSFGCGGDVYQDKGIPKLNDKTVFTFREENPGLAENFQLQVINRNGDILLAKNLGKTKAFHADSNFVYKILELMQRPTHSFAIKGNDKIANFKKLQKTSSAKIEKITKTKMINPANNPHSNKNINSGVGYPANGVDINMANNFNVSPRDQYMNTHRNEIKLFWKVIGTRAYKKNGTAKKEQKQSIEKTPKMELVTFVVEQSDSWPLSINDFTTGLTCKADHKTSNINIQNLDLGKGKEPGVTATVNYTGDHIELSGSFDLKKSPWAYREYNSNAVWIGPRNIFISWGDGVVEPLNLKKADKEYEINSMTHRYLSQGARKIRVFMLPEDDIQHNNPSQIVAAYNYYAGTKSASLNTNFKTIGTSQNDPYYQTLQLGGNLPTPNMDMVKISKHAYMLYCHKIVIDPRADLVASGPLHLESIAIAETNGGESSSKTTESGSNKLISSVKNGYKLSNKSTKKSTSTSNIKNISKNRVKYKETAEFTNCDSLQANAKLRYYGKGNVQFKWTLYGSDDSKLLLGTYSKPLGPSKQRKNLTQDNFNTPSSDSFSYFPVDSKVLELDKFKINKKYRLYVDATVDPFTASTLSQKEMLNEIADAIPHVQKIASNTITPQMLRVAFNSNTINNPYLTQIQKSGAKFGVLSPSKHLAKGMPMVANVNQAISHATGITPSYKNVPKKKPYYVKSSSYDFKVTPHAQGKPCKFVITTKSGDKFTVKNISKSVTEVSKGVYSGTGDIDISLNAGDKSEILLPVNIDHWKVDGMDVIKGVLDTDFSHQITENGMKISLKKLHCQANKSDMELKLDMSAQENTLRIPGSSKALEWKDITSKLSDEGDWLYKDTKQREFSIGWSGFRIKSNSMLLDLDTKNGKGVGSQCSEQGKNGVKWTGIHLGNATLTPNTFDLVQNGYTKQISDWGIAQTGSKTGLCGKTTLGHFSTNFKKGKISFDKIDIDTKGGNFKAIYKNMDVKVPWLDTHLKGDAQLIDGQPGVEASANFKGLKSPAISKSYKTLKFTADNLIFGSFEGVGWGVWSDTAFTFSTKSSLVTDKAVLNGLIFGMDGRAHLLKDKTSTTIPLGGKASFGKTTVDLIAADLKLHPKNGKSLIDFTIKTNFSISKVLPTVSVPVCYKLNIVGDTYSALGPQVPKFDVPVAFPAGNPNAEAKVTCDYKKDAGQSKTASISQNNFEHLADAISNFSLATPAYASTGEGSTKNDQYKGSVDLAMYGGPPIKAEFRLGYEGGADYWLIRATVGLGQSGVPFIPPLMNLYKIRGGLGHNFPVDAFKHAGTINSVYPDIDGSYMFMAGIRIGSSDKFTVTTDGDLTIKIGEAARMDFRAWLLSTNHSGDGNFQGYIQYGGGNFDGALEGKLDYLGGMVKFVIPHDAMTMHFGHGDWHIYAGKKEGPRIHVFIVILDTNGYFMLDPHALAVGGGMSFYLNAGIGHISGNLDMGLEIRVPPHIMGYAEGAFEAKICCCEVCVGPSISAGVKAEALPLKVSAHACVDLPWPLGGVCGSFSL
ncbi:MAG: hypothetical protein QM482_02425 [Sulfurospirillum sp.]